MNGTRSVAHVPTHQPNLFESDAVTARSLGQDIAVKVLRAYMNGGIAEETLLPVTRRGRVIDLVSKMTREQIKTLCPKGKIRRDSREKLIVAMSMECDRVIAEYIGWTWWEMPPC